MTLSSKLPNKITNKTQDKLTKLRTNFVLSFVNIRY